MRSESTALSAMTPRRRQVERTTRFRAGVRTTSQLVGTPERPQTEARGAMEEHPPISAETLRETVKDLTKKAKFGEACDRLRGWTERAEVVGSLRSDLLAAILRSATVLRSRHAPDSSGWRHGLRLFEAAAVAFEGHDDAGKISELLEAAALTVDADDDENAKNVIGSSEANEGERNAPKAFEGQFSGEVESEFDRQMRTAGPGTGGAIPAELFEMFRDPTETAERRRDALTRWLSSAHPSANAAADVDALMEVLSGFDASFGSDTAVDGAGFGARRTMGSAGSDALAALAERVVTLRTGDDVSALGESECPICRDEFDVGSRVIKMPCARTHVFHRDCVATWLRKDDSCPLCRSSLPIWLGRPQYA